MFCCFSLIFGFLWSYPYKVFVQKCGSIYFPIIMPVHIYSGKRNVTVWRLSVRPSFCLYHVFPTLMGRAAHTYRDSPGGSTRRGQRTFPSEYTCLTLRYGLELRCCVRSVIRCWRSMIDRLIDVWLVGLFRRVQSHWAGRAVRRRTADRHRADVQEGASLSVRLHWRRHRQHGPRVRHLPHHGLQTHLLFRQSSFWVEKPVTVGLQRKKLTCTGNGKWVTADLNFRVG